MKIRKYILVALSFLMTNVAFTQQTSGLVENIISNTSVSKVDFPLVSTDKVSALIRYDEASFKGVIRAIGDLQNDISSVTGIKPEINSNSRKADYEIAGN